MKLVIIRHGITDGNMKLSFNGSGTDEPLSPEGKSQLKEVENIPEGAVLFCSPMIRARETAEIMFPGKKAEVIEELREMHFGKFEGRNHASLDGDPDYQAWLDSGGTMEIPGGDSMEGFAKRVTTGISKAYRAAKSYGTECMYIVAHGGTIMAAMSMLTGEDYFDFNTPNGAGYELELEADDAGTVLAATTYDRFCGGLRSGSYGWRPPRYTPSDSVDR